MSNIKKSTKLLKTFLDDNFKNLTLKEQLEQFKNFDFSLLGEKQFCHSDSTDIAKAVYYIIWHDKLPNMRTLEEMDKYYGGETLNTFNTLFQSELNGIKKFINQETDNKFFEQIKQFKKKYSTIGNFMLLPALLFDRMSINQKKGNYSYKYKDYFDLFAVALFQTDEFSELKKANDFYFSKIDEKQFCKINFLENYFKNNKFSVIYNHDYYNGIYYPYYHWKYDNPELHKNEYIEFAKSYMQKASKIIDYRACKMCEELYKNLKEIK